MRQYRKACTLALGLALALVTTPTRAADVHKLLPDDTGTVIAVNVRQVLDSALVKKHALELIKQGLKDNDEIQKLMDTLGLDPLKDIDHVIVASPGLSETEKGLSIISGRFDPAKIRTTAADVAKKQADVLKIHKEGVYQIYEMKVPDQPQPLFAAVVDGTTLVVAPDKTYTLDALDKAAGKKATRLKNKEIAPLLQQVDGKQSMWAVVGSSALEKGLPGGVDEAVKEFLKKLDAVAGGVTVTDDIKAQVVLGAKDVQAGKDLHKAVTEGINQGLGILAILAANQKELAPLLDVVKGIKTDSKDKNVTITGSVSGELIEKLIKMGQ